MKKEIRFINYKVLIIIIAIIMLIPSIIYLISNKTVLNFTEWFTFFLHKPQSYKEAVMGAIVFGTLMIMLMIFYFKIIKKSNEEFKNIKSILLYVLLVAIIFGAMLPFTTSDIFYYMGTGWIDANYNENPYYTTVKEVRMENPNDEILQRTGLWETQVVVYGPLWAFICKILSFLSFGNVNICLYIYKIFAILVHVLNTYLVYKITKKNKLTLIYGLNPFILFEMITNVHNDIYLVFFMLLAIYYLLKKKNIILSVVFMALATCIKYVSVLLIPFMVLYYLKDRKFWKKVGYCILYAIIFLSVMAAIYLIYTKDLKLILISAMQQSKYRESILAIFLEISRKIGVDILTYGKGIFILIFAWIFIDGLIFMFVSKKINIRNTMRKYNGLILAFLFLIITNLCPWYTMWLIPTLFWQKGKNIKNIIYIQFSYELVTLINFALFSESYKIGLFYLSVMIILITMFNMIDKYRLTKKTKTCLC